VSEQRSLYERFAGSVRRVPGATALECADGTFSYAELDALAQSLAGELVSAAGGRAPRRVGLLAARTATAYAGYLAVQRLGATVVPLNPGFPEARNAKIAELAGLDLVLAQPDQAHVTLPVPVLTLDAAKLPERTAGAADLPDAPGAAGPLDICYILFTSGSTGAPKGVPIQQRNVSAYLDHVIDRYALGEGARLAQTFDLTFDLSVFDLFATWASGATLVVPAAGDLLAPARFVARERITHWFSVPSVVSLAMRLRGLAPGSMPSLRWSLFCGEPLTLAQARAWQAAAPGSVLENLYGPTELTLSCTQFRLPDDNAPAAGSTVPIGHLYPGLEQIVIGQDGLDTEEGELCVRGVQRFPGYLDPRDNAGRFVRYEDGHASVVEERTAPAEDLWYRTGDRVRRTGEGLVHLGRLDHQVKVRGYRVELGEIESALRAAAGVRDAVVVLVPGPGGGSRLEAACTGEALDPAGLRAELRARLPEYMVPDAVTAFETFPLNANGKTDRLALCQVLAPKPRVAR
jgi:amino acid adenylation domain-containing protein